MSKREELEEKRKELDKELNKHNNEDNSLYERSIVVAKLISILGNIAFVASIGLGLFTCISFNTFLLFRLFLVILYSLFGFVIKVFLDAMSLLLKNLAELNNK